MYISKTVNPPMFSELFKLAGGPESEKNRNVLQASILYIFREKVFNECFKGVYPFSEMPRVRNILCQFRFSIRLKLALLECKRLSADHAKAKEIFVKNGLSIEDAWLWGFAKTLNTPKADAWVKSGNKIPTAKEIREEAYRLIYTGSVHRVIRKTVGRKLWFIASSQPITLDDLEADVKVNAIESFYSTVPFLVEGHKKPAIARSAMNYISKIISHFTYSKRANMIQKDGKFYQMIDSLDAPMDPNGDKSNQVSRHWHSAVDQNSEYIKDNFEKFHSIRNIRDRQSDLMSRKALTIVASCSSAETVVADDVKATNNVKKFLRRVSEKFNREFRNVLEVVDEIGVNKFFNEVRSFVGLPVKKWKQLLSDLQSQLTNSVLIT